MASEPNTSNLQVCTKRVVWCSVLAMVVLRFCIGLHFFSEGTKKLSYNESSKSWELNVPTEALFRQAKGPFADFFHGMLPGFHDWENLLAVPKQIVPLSSDEIKEREVWHKDYQSRQDAAMKENKPVPYEFPEYAPYTAWANQIVEDLRPRLKAFTDVKGITKEQSAQAAEVFLQRQQQLGDFLAEENDSIEEYQHELWRLQQLEAQGGAGEVPFMKQRIAAKRSETTSLGGRLVTEVRGIERGLQNDLLGLLTEEQRDDSSLVGKVESVVGDPKQNRLQWMNLAVTTMLISVGVCLLLGFLSRIASLAAIGFLLTVMSMQLPWIEGAKADYFFYQLVEVAALVSILAYGAYRIPGIDYILRGFWCSCCGKK